MTWKQPALKPSKSEAMKYTLGTGYYKGNNQAETEDFMGLWVKNLIRYTNPLPQQAYFLSVGGSAVPEWIVQDGMPCPAQDIQIPGNLGHVHHLLNDLNPYNHCGWSAAAIILAMMAYNNETDFIFREQDVLAFGPYIERMYQEIGDAGMIFGSYSHMPCAQSLFLVKHHFIPIFVRDYLTQGSDRDRHNLTEHKFRAMEGIHPKAYKRFSFGYDRDRPITYEDAVWYGQKISQEEIDELRKRGML